MPYNRYQPQGGIDQGQAEWLGGMAYNPYSSGTDWGFTLRNTLNNLLAHKQAQDQSNQEQRRYDSEQAKVDKKLAMEEAKSIREQADAARKAQLEEKKFALDKIKTEEEVRKSQLPVATERDKIAGQLVAGGFAKDIPGAQMLIGGYETAADKMQKDAAKEAASEAKTFAREAERDQKAENKALLDRTKDLAIKITGKIRGIEKDPLRGVDDPQIKDLKVMNNFLQRRMNKAIAGKLGDEDKDMLNKVAMAIESGDVGTLGETGVAPETTATPTPPAPAIPPGAKTATNPMTGEKLALVNGQWIKIS
jgi:hypothetical protein